MSVYVLNKLYHLYDCAIFIQNLLGCAVIALLCGALITAVTSLDSKSKGDLKAAEKLKKVSITFLSIAVTLLLTLIFVYPENDTLRYWQSAYDIKGVNQ